MQGLRPLYRYFDFTGRSGRAEFWQFQGLIAVGTVIAFLLDSAMGNVDTPALTMIVIAATIIPAYAVAARRLHDRDWSAKWLVGHAAAILAAYVVWRAAGVHSYSATGDVLVTVAKILDWVVRGFGVFLFLQFVRAGEDGTNRFGPPPSYEDPAPTFGDLAQKLRAQAQPARRSDRDAPAAGKPIVSVAPRRGTEDADPLGQIERLAKLRDAGMLTDDEFQEQKASLLSRL